MFLPNERIPKKGYGIIPSSSHSRPSSRTSVSSSTKVPIPQENPQLSKYRSSKGPSPHSSSKRRKPQERKGTSKSSPSMGHDKGDGRHLIKPSPNRAFHVEPSPAEKNEAEEIARDILGHFFEVRTVKIIIKLQATRMNPLERKLVRDVLNYDKKAETDLACLAKMLEDWGKDGSF
jgi:hypothetical protein